MVLNLRVKEFLMTSTTFCCAKNLKLEEKILRERALFAAACFYIDLHNIALYNY